MCRSLRALTLAVALAVTACGADTSTPTPTTQPTASTSTVAATTTTGPRSSTTAILPAEAAWPFGDRIPLDVIAVAGDLPAAEGWELLLEESGPMLIVDPETVCPEAGETCAAGFIRADAYPAGSVPGWDGYLDVAQANGLEGDDLVLAALEDWVAAFYAWIAVQDWDGYEFGPIEPAPSPVGSLAGLHFGYHGVDGGESIHHTDGYVAYDGTYLYVITLQLPELIPTFEPVDFVAEFAPHLAEFVADFRLPVEQPERTPSLTSDWSLQEGDILVSRHNGIVVVRGDPTADTIAHVVSTEPTAQAHHDRMDGIVLQRAHPAGGPVAEPPWEMAIWWVPEPGADPVVLHEPDPGRPANLFGVAEIDGIPHALYMQVDLDGSTPGYVLVAHDLASREARVIGSIGGGEVWPSCVSWATDRFVVSSSAEENSWFEFLSSDGEILEAESPVSIAGTWYASTCAALRETDLMAAVVLRTFEGPNHLVIVDVAAGAEVQRIEIDAEELAAGAEAEIWPGDIGRWESRIDFVGDRVLISDVGYGVSGPFLVDLITGEITMISVEGMATLVR